ncbi:MAG: hypothetical protein ABIG03_02385 [Candidatus Eisenbacteria bacterium]
MAAALALAVGCTQHAKVLCEPLNLASRARFDEAVVSLDETDVAESKDDRFLYHAQRGHLLHLAGEHAASNAEFEKAAGVARELEPWSVTETITDYTFNEAVKAYAGEDFERAYLHYYMALNYLALGDVEGAVIECRRLDEVFRELDARYEEDTGRYQDDGFIRYLSALLYDALGEEDDAFIDYELAVRAYEGETGEGAGMGVPSELLDSYVCAGRELGRDDRVAALVGQHDIGCPRPLDPGAATRSEIVVLIDSGWAPYKREEALRVPIARHHVPEDYWDRGWVEIDAVVKIALPVLESVPNRSSEFSVAVERVSEGGFGPAARSVPAQRVQDVDGLARWALERRTPALVARSAVRATLKTVAVLRAQHEREEGRDERKKKRAETSFWTWLADVFVDHIVPIAVSETEQADTRSWILLPSEIWMARISAQPGEYELTVQPENGAHVYLGSVTVREGEKTFVSHRVFGSPHPIRCDTG